MPQSERFAHTLPHTMTDPAFFRTVEFGNPVRMRKPVCASAGRRGSVATARPPQNRTCGFHHIRLTGVTCVPEQLMSLLAHAAADGNTGDRVQDCDIHLFRPGIWVDGGGPGVPRHS